MEIFKQSLGFVLLVIAVKLFGALPAGIRINVLYYSVILGFCGWMWGGWVSYGSRLSRKIVIRVIAVALAAVCGFAFLSGGKESLIDWQEYDAALVEQAKAEGRPVLIKFTADWCLSCEVVERTVYSKEVIAELIKQKNVLAVRGDTTRRDQPATIALQDVYNEPGVPVSMLFVPGKERIAWRGLRFGDKLRKELEGIESR
jgi:thiol:disulfide interchange protein DsbD